MVCGDSYSNDFNGFHCQDKSTPAPLIKIVIHSKFVASYKTVKHRKKGKDAKIEKNCTKCFRFLNK